MNSKNSEPLTLMLSTDLVKEQLRRSLYNLGYASKPGEHIEEISFGALHDTHVPIQFWIEKSHPEEEEEVQVTEYNGKG